MKSIHGSVWYEEFSSQAEIDYRDSKDNDIWNFIKKYSNVGNKLVLIDFDYDTGTGKKLENFVNHPDNIYIKDILETKTVYGNEVYYYLEIENISCLVGVPENKFYGSEIIFISEPIKASEIIKHIKKLLKQL